METVFLRGSVHNLKCFAMWNSAKWILLPVFHHNRPTISTQKIEYEMHVGIFFTCKHVMHFTTPCIATQHSRIATNQDSVQARAL
jgi:hypothetical protein